MLLTQSLTPPQLAVGTGDGAERGTLLEDGLLLIDEGPLLIDECVVVAGGLRVVVEDKLGMVVEDGLLLVDRRVETVDEDVVEDSVGDVVEGGGDPPVIRFLIARS